MSTQKNLITLCFAAVFTLGLAACGGGGGGGDAPVTGRAARCKPAAPSSADLFATAVIPHGRGRSRRPMTADALKAATDNRYKFGTLRRRGRLPMAATNERPGSPGRQAATVMAATRCHDGTAGSPRRPLWKGRRNTVSRTTTPKRP